KTIQNCVINKEIHAELCYAEALLLKSMLTFVEDETLVSFIKAGLKIRSCFNSYKECSNILHQRNWGDESHKVHFESGVRMGIGAFNLMISLLPARVIKLLEFIGFSGSKGVGLQELETGYRLHHSIRQVLCVMTLLGYHLIVVYVLSHTDGDLDFCDEILRSQLQLYPQGVWFLFFKGRLEFMKGNIDESISWYIKSWRSQSMWPQFHHLCFWELVWTNSVKGEWREASKYADWLFQESRWSKTIYSYQKAALLSMLGDEMSFNERTEVENLMRRLLDWKQRIAGKSLPMEKFVVKKTDRFFAQKKMLVLPAYELLYVWNLFKVLGKRTELIHNVYKTIDKIFSQTIYIQKSEKKKLMNFEIPEPQEFDADNRALILLLKGASLRQMQSPLQAEECLNNVIALEKKIKEDHYLIPYATVELAQLYREQKNITKASQLLEDAKGTYRVFPFETKMHKCLLVFNLKDISHLSGRLDRLLLVNLPEYPGAAVGPGAGCDYPASLDGAPITITLLM
ncbi:hypothetical protein L9F63_025722, partial [Diploptera punctata]